METDYYELLEVSRTATADELKRAYRRRARQLHPDANPGDPAAEALFKQVAMAYETLSDPERRQRYDRFGAESAGQGSNAGFGGGLGDLFETFFGGNPFGNGGGSAGPPRGADLEVVLDLAFEEAVFGTQAPVTLKAAVPCDVCEATGAESGTTAETCSECGGVGQVRRVRQSILGQMMTTGPCTRCSGTGTLIASPCRTCRGEGRTVKEQTYTVDVPAGIDTGSTLRLTGRGEVGPRGGRIGDLYVHLRVRPHERFVRHGYDLAHELHVSMTQATFGTHIEFETLDGVEDLVIPSGTQSTRIFRLRGRGVPHVEGRGRGDLLVQVMVDTPTALSEDEETLLRSFAEMRGEELSPVDGGLLSKIRSAFK
ncbi:MAG: molecular chaperone DnaJ [Actinomycetes bacterium]